MEIHNAGGLSVEAIQAGFTAMSEGELRLQEMVQQAAIHALSSVLAFGCSEAVVSKMLADARVINTWVRQEFARRGEPPAFETDQVVQPEAEGCKNG